MLHIDQASNLVYVYSTRNDLNNLEINLSRKKGRDRIEYNSPLSILFYGNSFYKLELTTPPALDSVEYDYEITANGEIIDKGILRYGTI